MSDLFIMPPKVFRNRVKAIPALFSLLLASCNNPGTFKPENCPGTHFPSAQEMMRVIAERPYEYYFTNIMSGTALFKFETWSDQKFEYDRSLNLYYLDDNYLDNRCAKAFILRLKMPLDSERKNEVVQYTGYISKKYQTSLKSAEEFATKIGSSHSYIGFKTFSLGNNHILEIAGFHHPARGEFIELGWYEKIYYEAHFNAKTGSK